MKHLIRKSELEDKSFDNSNIYRECALLLDKIKETTNEIINYTSFSDLDNIINCINYIDNILYDIYYNIDTAKDNGISNEENLGYGNEIIDKLNQEIEDLINEKNELESKLANFNTNQMKRLHKTSRFICNVHDDIMKLCDSNRKYMQSYIIDITNATDEHDEAEFSRLVEDIEWSCNSLCDDIENYIDEANDLNERMGNGLARKNALIEELRMEIESLRNEIQLMSDNL